MKILLVSDSHGYDDELKKVLENGKCESFFVGTCRKAVE